jgi:tetratricopeptide (TPR) repeat protein
LLKPPKLKCKLLVAIAALCCLQAQAQPDQSANAKTLFARERWPELVALLEHAPRQSADLNYYYGVALAHVERWQDSRQALLAGQRLAPRDKRFPEELAGVAFKEKQFGQAKAYLRGALQLDPKDAYATDFLATIYFLEGNIEAAVKYWNRASKPEIAEVSNEPALRTRPALLDHAIAFSAASVLTVDQLLISEERLRMLQVLPNYRFDLVARNDEKFDVILRATELNGFGASKLEALLRTFGGVFFQEITPEYYNARGSATNLVSMVRWDPDKRRAYIWLSGPFGTNPRWRYRIGTDLRDENWDVQTSFAGPTAVLGSLNLRREAVTAEISRLVGARLKWSTGLEISHRDYRNVLAGTAFTPQLLPAGYQLKQTAQLTYDLWRLPEHRLEVSTAASSQAGRIWAQPEHAFEKLQALLEVHWMPQPRGDDYANKWLFRAGKSFGQLPFDELYMLGMERDSDLWLHGHVGTRHGRKGSAPLGRDYFLLNWESDKNLYSNGLLTIKLGPVFDAGKITDSSSALGSHQWLFDIGAQAKLHVLGIGVVFSYGKDLRSGNNAFFSTLAR